MTRETVRRFLTSLLNLRLFPIVSGAAWLITLSTLFIYWLAQGRPRYPAQNNPYVAFISDIGAFDLQPFFIVGGTLTAVTLLGTIISVHYVFHSNHTLDNGVRSQRYKKGFSMLACLLQVVACPCQICLTLFDNKGYPRVHRFLLFGAFAGTALSAVCTTTVFWDEIWRKGEAKELKIIRRSAVGNTIIIGMQFCMSVAFTVLLYMKFYRISGILEWVMAFLFTLYFFSFSGLLMVHREEEGKAMDEETPLLQ